MAKAIDVDAALDARAHPLREQIDAVRGLVLAVDPRISEQWKWNGPSFRVDADPLLTFMLRDDDRLLLVVHHASAPEVASPLLEGDYSDGRRTITLRGPDDVATQADELTRVVRELVARTPAVAP